ncbi:uncharacterized protein LOC124156647 [Ischnura elegans]|uniref:uncharacterized protein LOC124156647 n=1 Tax=Ischnura elegans TaxID=197161 RepID=UPI001ED87DC5|nr:uncharacterized protein LOC124156647 [Ischnura elegans]
MDEGRRETRALRDMTGGRSEAMLGGTSGVWNEAAIEVARERELLRRERDILDRERRLLEREREMLAGRAALAGNASIGQHEMAERLLPEFDPSLSIGFTAEQWIRRVESVALAYAWEDSMVLTQAVHKLRGAAATWLNSVAEEVYSWEEFKRKLRYSFPSSDDQAEVHMRLSRKKKQRNETYETYVYSMKALASRGDIENASLIRYILNGIGDRELVKLLALSDFQDVEGLLSKIKRYECVVERTRVEEKPFIRSLDSTSSEKSVDRPWESKGERKSGQMKFFNCAEFGHMAKDCQKPAHVRLCFTCKKSGHVSRECPQANKRNGQAVERRGNVKIISWANEKVKDEYHKWVEINNDRILGFVDLGSEVVTMRKDVAEKIGLKYEKSLKRLSGFGCGGCRVIGSNQMALKVDGVDFNVEVLIVPDYSQDDAIIIGRSALDQRDIRVEKEYGELRIIKLDLENGEEPEPKVRTVKEKGLIRKDDIKISDNLTEREKDAVCDLVNEFRECFAMTKSELGTAKVESFDIAVNDEQPVNLRPYRLPYAQRAEMQREVDELLKLGIIEESTSDYASPALLVKKASGENRLCIDYRELNRKTKKVKFPSRDR